MPGKVKAREIDYDKMELAADKLLNLLKILNYLENTDVREIEVTANPGTETEFRFEVADDILKVALIGLQSQLKKEVKLTRPNLI